MVYSSETHITTIADVKAFFHHIVFDMDNLDFHPDDKFRGNEKLTVLEAANYDRLMTECFAVCETCGQDIYQIGMTELRNYMVKH